MTLNLQRLTALPHALKPILVVILFVSMIAAGCVADPTPGAWFFWLTTVIQFIFMVVVTSFFVMQIERLFTCGRDSWPVAELVYTLVFFVLTVINVFINAGWYREDVSLIKVDDSPPHLTTMAPGVRTSGAAVFSAIVCVALGILYALGFFMMYRIWRGHVKSGESQNPTANTMPGSVDGMHPGI